MDGTSANTDPVKILPEAGMDDLDRHLRLLTALHHTGPVYLNTISAG